MAHTYIEGVFYADTAFLNSMRGIPGVSLEHAGFGEFYAETPHGRVEFDRMRGKDFPGQSGRSHKVYDRNGGYKATGWLIEQVESRGQSSRVAKNRAKAGGSFIFPEDLKPRRFYIIDGVPHKFVSKFLGWDIGPNGPTMAWEDVETGDKWESYMHQGRMCWGTGADPLVIYSEATAAAAAGLGVL